MHASEHETSSSAPDSLFNGHSEPTNPMVTFSHNGADWIGQRFGFALNGVLGASACCLLDWLLPTWLKDVYMAWDHFHRVRSVDGSLKAGTCSRKIRITSFVVHSLCLATFRTFLVPYGREVLFYHGTVGYALGMGVATFAYVQSDGTPDEQRLSMFAHRDAALCYFSTGYSLVHRWWLWSWFCLAIVWIFLPLICLSGGVWFCWHQLPDAVRAAPLWLFVKAAALFMEMWDLCDKIEAHMTERIPKWLQYKLHRHQQERRRSVPPYAYSPLQHGEIRLLRLKKTCWWLPGSIEAELIHAAMHPAPEYETVSYRWGSSERTEVMILDGATLGITRSAYDLLMARRSVWRSRTIWIDAICINQSDEQEKAAQVQLMRDIYHRAKRVVIYTGGDWTARLAAPLLYETVAATYQFDASVLELNKLTNGEKLSTKWKALKKLLMNDYFTRSWVVQEVAVGQKVELYYGGLYISWSIFLQLAMHLVHPHRREMLTMGDRDDASFLGSSSLENIAVMSFLRPDSRALKDDKAEPTSLDSVLFSTFTFRATDPRDKVFAVLGLATYEMNDLLRPDYSKSTSQVYRDTAEYLFFYHDHDRPSINMLALAGTGYFNDRLAIPSWVPNFDQGYLWFPYTDLLSQDGTFQASGGRNAEIKKGLAPNSLSIKGIMCDSVIFLGITTVYEGQLRPGPQLDASYVSRHKHEVVADTQTSIRQHKSVWPDADHVAETQLWLALVGGRIDRKRPSPDRDWRNVYVRWAAIVEGLEKTQYEDHLQVKVDQDESADQSSVIAEGDVATFDSAFEGCYGRRFAITKQGRLCWVPPYTEMGDRVFIPFGAQTPFLVRAKGRTHEEDVYELVGEAYVQGLMWGDLMGDGLPESFITLI